MSHTENETYFTTEALAKFAACQGKIIEKIVCHLWQNSNNPNEILEIIDNVELHFTDKNKLTIACNQNADGLDVIDFNYKETAIALHKEFEGKIKLFALNASATEMWEAVIGQPLLSVQITRQDEYYKADSLMLNFGEERRIITINPLDGLIIDYYEEV